MSPARTTARRSIDERLRHLRQTHARFGVAGLLRSVLNRLLVRGASVSLVHVLCLDSSGIRTEPVDSGFERRFLTPDEVRRHAADPSNNLPPDFADRAGRGMDVCFGAIRGDRLASYGWYARDSIEPEHAAGTPVGLPQNVAYMYKLFTHPDFRGRRLNGACVRDAAVALSARGVDRIVGMVYWSNEASMRSLERLGFRRLGLLVVGPRGPLRIPCPVLRLGLTFGPEAEAALEARNDARRAFRTEGQGGGAASTREAGS